MIVENRQEPDKNTKTSIEQARCILSYKTFVNGVAGLCIFLFLILQYEERRFDRGVPIQDIIRNDSFKVTKANRLSVHRIAEKVLIIGI